MTMMVTIMSTRRLVVYRNTLCKVNDRLVVARPHQTARRWYYFRPQSSSNIQHLPTFHKLPKPPQRSASFSSSSSSFVSNNRSNAHEGGGGGGGGDPKAALSQLAKNIYSLQQNLDALPPLPPVWQQQRRSDKNNNNNNTTNETSSTTSRLRRREVLHATRLLVQQMQQMIDRGVLDPNSRYSREMSFLLEHILKLYSQCQPDTSDDTEDHNATISTGAAENNDNNSSIHIIPSVFDECQRVLHMFRQHPGLQNRRQRGHDLYVMMAAANEQKWQQASDLFLACIDPDQTGYSPFDIDVANPVPLYAVARHAQQYQQHHHRHHHHRPHSSATATVASTAAATTTSTAVENVMDAVHQMTLVSPTDEARYTLAAGTALGLAGECKALVQYLERKTSLGSGSGSSSSKQQQSLVAATMQACLLCHEPELAMQVFDSFFGHEQALAASEWLWAGGQDCMSPLCRDLAMRAVGACAWNQSERQHQQQQLQRHGGDDMAAKSATAKTQDQDDNNWSATRALAYYRDAKAQGMAISLQALQSVVLACECDGKWQEAVELLLSVLSSISTTTALNQDSGNAATGVVVGSSSSWIVRGEELNIQSMWEGAAVPYVQDLQQKLAPILETTMRACNATGHYGVSMLCLRLWGMSLRNEEKHGNNSVSLSTSLIDSLAPLMMVGSQGGNNDSLLRTTMVSLCGVKCTEEAARLYEAVTAMAGSQDIICQDAQEIYDFVRSPEGRFTGLPAMSTTPPPWETVDLEMQKLIALLNNPAQRQGEVSQGNKQQQRHHLLLQSSVAAQSIRHCTSLGQPLAGIYWLVSLHGVNEEISRVTLDIPSLVQHLNWNNAGESAQSSKLLLTDSLLSATMEAYTAMQEPSLALELFEALFELEQIHRWVFSRNVALDALFACNRDENAIAMLEDALATSVRNPDTFSIAARWLSTRRDWSKVENIYRLALSTGGGGCISESLCLQAIKAVSEERSHNANVKIRILRTILDEVAKLMGVTTSDWVEGKYWDLKSHVRFADLRSLLWWEDPTTAFLDELELAVGVFEKRREMSLTPKHAALRTIVRVAKDYHDDMVPVDKTQIPRVPRNLRDWNTLVTSVLREAEGTSLLQDPEFVDDAATALSRLGQEDAAAAWRRQVDLGI